MTQQFTFFWANGSSFSNWHRSRFVHNGIEYNTSEQYMMHMKAKLFEDAETAALIMKEKDPRKQKALGRQVRNFDQAEWEANAVDIMVSGLISKFVQNPVMRQELLNTGDTIIAEASPYDTVWGIGLAEDDPRAQDQSQWLGKNLLGVALMEVRDVLASSIY